MLLYNWNWEPSASVDIFNLFKGNVSFLYPLPPPWKQQKNRGKKGNKGLEWIKDLIYLLYNYKRYEI